MNTQIAKPLQVVGLVLCTLALQGCAPQGSFSAATAAPHVAAAGSEQSSDELFTDVPETMVQALAEDDEPGRVLRTRQVQVNFGYLERALASGASVISLNINPFTDVSAKVVINHVERISEKNVVMSGEIVDDADSAVTLVMNDGVLVGSLKRSDSVESFQIRHLGQGVHVVEGVNGEYQRECPEAEPSTPEEIADAAPVTEELAAPMALPVINMLVTYTPNARIREGGKAAIEALIQSGIADTNAAFEKSGANVRVRLAGTLELRQNETGNWSRDLDRLRSKTDSLWNEVHAARERLDADQVTVVGSYRYGGSTAGIGYILSSSSTSTSGFSIVRASAFDQYTFTHELGHNLGLRHSDGYTNYSARFRTIMQYGSYTRIRRFSNPNMTYNGYRTGTGSDNSVSKINRNANRVANFR